MEMMPRLAPLVVLAFLGTFFLLAMCALALLVAIWRQRLPLARIIVAVALVVGMGYGGVLLAASLFSSEKVLAAGQRKYFCEIDCHLAYTVSEVATAQTLGSGANEVNADGTFYIVMLKTYFDEKTTSVNRGNGLLVPNDRVVMAVDENGGWHGPSLPGQKALDVPAAKLVPLTQSLRPGDSYETTLVFDLPAGVKNPRLLLTDPVAVNWVLIGHENSFFHKKIYFELQPRPAVSQAHSVNLPAGSSER